ncbi:MAG: type II secretion system protein [Pseudomonadota bacterium]
MRRRQYRGKEAGFSLLEILVVTAILAGAAYVALDTVEHDSGQIRFETTERRLAAIRRAIVGEPGVYANGAPVVQGYVADVGQLPPCLEALLQQIADCDDDGTDEIAPNLYAVTDGVIAFGWRGPYLTGSGGVLRDAWGNTDEDVDGDGSPDGNRGWDIVVDDLAPSFDASSRGRDRAAGDVGGEGGYSVDQVMQTIDANDLTVSLTATAVNVMVTNNTAADIDVCLAVITPDTTDAEADDWTYFPSDAGPETVLAGASTTLNYSSAGVVTPGLRTFAVYDENNADVTNCVISAGQEATVLGSAATRRYPLLLAARLAPSADLTFAQP